MDFKSPFTLQCVLVIIIMINGKSNTVNGIIGGSVNFPLGIQSLKNLARVTWGDDPCVKPTPYDTSSTDCDTYCNKIMCLQSRSLQLKNVSRKNEGKYEFALTNTSKKSFLLKVSGKANHSSLRFRWKLNGQPVALTETEDDGKWIILAKEGTGKLDCQIHYKNSINECSVIEVECNERNLLQQPLFIYTLAACGGGAIVLAVIASLITCCCLKSKQQFIPVPSEEEKEEGMTMSVISNEETKSPPNGDHHEAPSAPDDSPPNPGWYRDLVCSCLRNNSFRKLEEDKIDVCY
uniref:Immunoglobulin V-set domain-containing protein n=1 Tax=Terrapene triunguis TaxID=2587831 RepID=A0A674I936_9SAUR